MMTWGGSGVEVGWVDEWGGVGELVRARFAEVTTNTTADVPRTRSVSTSAAGPRTPAGQKRTNNFCQCLCLNSIKVSGSVITGLAGEAVAAVVLPGRRPPFLHGREPRRGDRGRGWPRDLFAGVPRDPAGWRRRRARAEHPGDDAAGRRAKRSGGAHRWCGCGCGCGWVGGRAEGEGHGE